MQDLKILFLQSDLVWENPEKNRAIFLRKIEQAFSGEDLIVLPETFTTGFPVNPIDFAETTDGESLKWMAATARKYQAVLTGSLLINNQGSYSNTLIWMRPNGTFERYDKRHVFSMGGEHKRIKAGEKELIVELKRWKIKPMICYDLRFPVWSKNRFENGSFAYDMALYVANWPAVRAYPWKQLLMARAIENLSYVLGVNRTGYDGLGNDYKGDSMLVDFKGQPVATCAEGEACTGKTTLSHEKLIQFRNKFQVGPDWDFFEHPY